MAFLLTRRELCESLLLAFAQITVINDFSKPNHPPWQTSQRYSSPEPEEYKIIFDENGYINVDELINKLNAQNDNINFEILQHIVDINNKKRFEFNDNLA